MGKRTININKMEPNINTVDIFTRIVIIRVTITDSLFDLNGS